MLEIKQKAGWLVGMYWGCGQVFHYNNIMYVLILESDADPSTTAIDTGLGEGTVGSGTFDCTNCLERSTLRFSPSVST